MFHAFLLSLVFVMWLAVGGLTAYELIHTGHWITGTLVAFVCFAGVKVSFKD